MDMKRWTSNHAIVQCSPQIAPSDGNLQAALMQKGWFDAVVQYTRQRQLSTKLVEGAATGDQWPEFQFQLDPDNAAPKQARASLMRRN